MADGTDADLMSMGEHCSVSHCQQIDFLPFKCDCCSKVFCLEHRTYQAHQCPNAQQRDSTTILCPLCAKAVKLAPGQDPNVVFDFHTQTDCDPNNYAKVHRKPRCPVHGCKERLSATNTYRCKDCQKVVCLRHRFASDHQCTGKAADTVTAATMARQQLSAALRQTWGSMRQAAGPVTQASKATAKPVSALAAEPGNTLKGTVQRRMQVKVTSGASSSSSASQPGEAVQPSIQGASSTASEELERCPHCSQLFDVIQLVQHVEREHSVQSRSTCVVC